MTSAVAVNPPGLHAVPAYSHAVVRRGTPVHLTGQIALDAAGELVGDGDAGAQAEQCWRNIEVLVDALGARLSDVVKITTFAIDRADLPAIAEARARRFDGGRFPASTFLVVAGLARPDLLVEIEATVVLSDEQLDRLGRAAEEEVAGVS